MLDETQEVIMSPKLLMIAIAVILNAMFSAFAYADSETEARKLINTQGCKACHTLAGNGGVIAGSFEAMRDQLTPAQVRSQLVNPERKHGNDKIPDFSHLSEEEIDLLVNFIQPKP
jgi:mono/diheme cytochrome c family protein